MLRGERIKLFKTSNQDILQEDFKGIIKNITETIPYLGIYDAKPHSQEFYEQRKAVYPNGHRGDWRTVVRNPGERRWKPCSAGNILGDILECADMLYAIHLGLKLPIDDLRAVLNKGADVAVFYFWGDWRDDYVFSPIQTWNRSECRKNLNWIDPFSRALLFALLLKDHSYMTTFAKWVDDDLREDGVNNYKITDAWYFVALGHCLQGKPFTELADMIKAKSSKRPKLLISILEALHDKDAVAFEKSFTAFVKYYIKREANPTEWFESNVSREASVLWNIANQIMMKMPEFPEEVMDRVVTPQSLGLVP